MGFDTEIEEIFSFIYEAEFKNGLTEKEYDHVFRGKWDGALAVNAEEVADYKWVSRDVLEEDMEKNPEIFTAWFKIAWRTLQSRQENDGFC
ncbi:MAG: Isopentenyl-diphosphate Delta-isomerase [Firmicutes bacterium ADurb.Bin456]|nr:MAG: Isopentenyl-diphosphate Delta-isomerase [Firmicutes bacterium ADurb.Bin456]